MNTTDKTLSETSLDFRADLKHAVPGKTLDEFPDEDGEGYGGGPIPIKNDPDMKAILEHIITGKPLDPEILRRVRECSEKATQELFEKHGFLNVAVDLIRECRDEQ